MSSWMKHAMVWGAAATLLITGCGKPAAQAGGSQGAGPAKVFGITLDGAKNREAELQAVAGYLKQIGIDAQVRTWEYNTLVEEAKASSRLAYATDWGSSTFSPFDLAIPKLKSKDRGNFSHYSNPELDTLFALASSTLDEVKAKDAYFKAQDLLKQDAPWIFGYYMDTIEAASSKVKNWRPSTDGRINLHKVSLEGGDTLVVGLRSDKLLSLDPANYRDRETETVIRNMFDGLVTRTPDGQVAPELATAWSTPDDKTFVFKLRDGVRFHNGDPLTADDVVFTFSRILAPDGMDGKPSPRQGLLGPLQKVEKVDPLTVKMSLSSPSPVFLQLLVHTQIIPETYYKQVGFAGFGQKPVGAGPFKFAGGTLNSQITLERFDGYWGSKAPLAKAVFRMMPEPGTRIAALKAGEVQIIQEVPVDSEADLKKDAHLQVQVAQGTRLYEIELNCEKLTDPKVRQALNYAVNWDEIVRELYKGHARRVSTALLPSGIGYNKALEAYPYDPAKAKALLKEAGYATK